MFNSTKLRDLSSLNTKSDAVNDTSNRTSAGSSFIQPKVTSTPLRRGSIFATPPKPRVLSPRRYSLSEFATPPRINRRDFIRAGSHQNLPGPLLASTKYNVSVSTYEDTKAPGLVSRLVQYHEEAEKEKEKRLPTHQAKYGSPGLFPIVHLFKKKLPVLEQKPRHVTVKIASPDKFRPQSQEHHRQLLGGIVKQPSTVNHTQQSNNHSSTSPRSVLDALKEISRKRIHSTEVVEVHEDSTSKRIRTENGCAVDSTNKRQRDKTPPLENIESPTNKQVSKKICMYDEYAASRSSMDFSALKKPEPQITKRKSISIHTLTDSPKELKQIKLVHAGTQTPAEEADESTNTRPILTEPIPEETKTKNDQPSSEKKTSTPLKVFDEAPLDRIRKNRLAALLGSLAGVDPVLEPKPDKASLLEDKAKEVVEKPLVSILSTSTHKSPEKHVHFNIPESNSNSSTLTQKTPEKHVHFNIPESNSNSLVMNGSASVSVSIPSALLQVNSTPSIAPSFDLGKSVPTSTPMLSFGKDKVDAVIPSSLPSFSLPKATSPPIILVSSSSASVSSSLTAAPTTSPPKMGGFKFDLGKPSTPPNTVPKVNFMPPASTTVSFSFGAKTPTASIVTSTSSLSVTTTTSALDLSPITSSSVTPTGAISFASSAPSAPTLFGASSVAVTKTAETATTVAAQPPPALFSFGASSAASAPIAFNFDSPTSKPSSTASPVGTTPRFAGGFGATSTSSGFTTSAASLGGFAVAASISTAPVSSSTTKGFSSPATPSFGNKPPATAPPAYGTNNSTLTGSTAPSFAFNGVGIVGTAPPAAFGATSAAAVTQASAFSAAPFGASTAFGGTVSSSAAVPSFSNTTTPTFTFGAKTTASGTFGGFGAPATTSSTFGAPITTNTTLGAPTTTNSTFGAPTTTNHSFGRAPSSTNSAFVVPVTTNNTFGAPNTASNTFGAPTTINSTFGARTTTNSTFGAPTAISSTFGAPTTINSAFGVPTTTNSTFGTPTTINSTFGTPTTMNNTFGAGFSASTTSNAFGGFGGTPTATTTSSSAFGGFGPTTTTASTNMFGGFGTTNVMTNTSSFGVAPQANAFGTSSPAGFGASGTTPSFGTTNNTPKLGGFGAAGGTANPTFTATSPPATGFSASGTFGGTAGTAFGASQPQSAVFSFGASNAAPKPAGVFSFGSTASNDKPKFEFGGTNGVPFGGGAAPGGFGATVAAPAFGMPPQNPVAGTFSIGSGPRNSGRTRTQIKARRRT